MARRITHVRLEGGEKHEHIVHLWWTVYEPGMPGDGSRAEVVRFIEGGGRAYVADGLGNVADVGVVTPASGPKYVRTHADGIWTDNLLYLPRR